MYFSRINQTPYASIFDHLSLDKLDVYKSHRLVWEFFDFDKDAKRDFLYRMEYDSNKKPLFYIVSKRKPQPFSDLFAINTKAYNPKIRLGQKFHFSLRVNPIVKRKHEGKKNSSCHDIGMDAKFEARCENMDKQETLRHIEKRIKEWLINNRASSAGFLVLDGTLETDGYIQHKVYKSKGAKPIQFSTIDYTGTLKVTQEELFMKSLFEGIGHSKAFGCGLLLIRS